MLSISEKKSLTVVQLLDFYLLEQEKRPWSLNGRMTGAKFYHDLVCERNAMRSLYRFEMKRSSLILPRGTKDRVWLD